MRVLMAARVTFPAQLSRDVPSVIAIPAHHKVVDDYCELPIEPRRPHMRSPLIMISAESPTYHHDNDFPKTSGVYFSGDSVNDGRIGRCGKKR